MSKKNYRFKFKDWGQIIGTTIGLAISATMTGAFIYVIQNMNLAHERSVAFGSFCIACAICLGCFVHLVYFLVYRVVVEGATIKVRRILGTKKMNIDCGVKCHYKKVETRTSRSYSVRCYFTLANDATTIKFILRDDFAAEKLLCILSDTGVNIYKDNGDH